MGYCGRETGPPLSKNPKIDYDLTVRAIITSEETPLSFNIRECI